MKFLADENISTKVVNNLKNKGIDIVSVKEINAGLGDEAVLEIANAQNRILLTFDDDFGELIYRRKLKAYGIVLLRFLPKSTQQIYEILSNVLDAQNELEGNFVIVTENRIRIHRLRKKV
ncbi:MAG: DUF5615 family PIN-like protein [Candidatus Bathyarchaeota archaeon]|nr:DUF5615 family PIN-like protein [Candidatus Bathyarchaeota archaeon]